MTTEPGAFDAKATYNTAARDYDDASRDYWQFLSARAVEHAELQPGDHVLDVPCGAGPSVLAAAGRVGPAGRVLGIDFAPRMLDIAMDKVAARELRNVELRIGDMTALGLEAQSFDAVVCVLGLFFVEDMGAVVRALSGLLKPDRGRLVVAVLGQHFFTPMRDVFVDAVAAVCPDVQVQQPWKRTEDPEVLRSTLALGGVGEVDVTTSRDKLPLPSPDDWWRIVSGTGLRATVENLSDSERAAVRARCDQYIREHHVDEVVLETHIARATSAASL